MTRSSTATRLNGAWANGKLVLRHSPVLIIGLAMLAAACGQSEVTQEETTTTSTSTTVPTSPPDTIPSTSSTSPIETDVESRPVDHAGWIEQEWQVLDGVDPWAAAWGTPGMVVLGYTAFHPDDSPTPNGLWFSDGSAWTETLIRDVAIADEYGFTPDVTDLVWFGGRFLAFLMGDATTTPGRASMLASSDGVHWDLEYLGRDPTATSMPVGLYATPESPPWPGTSAVSRIVVHNGELTAVGWTVLSLDGGSVSVPIVWRSNDGRNWSTTVLPNANFDNEWARDVAVGPLGFLVAVMGPRHQSSMMWYSPDGNDWDYVGDSFNEGHSIVSFAVGERALLTLTMDAETDGQPLSLWRSLDGTQWQEVDTPFVNARTAEGWYLADLASDHDGLVAMAGNEGQMDVWRTTDGLDWIQLRSVIVPAGEPLVQPYPLWPSGVVAGDELAVVATLPGRVIRWTEAAQARLAVLVPSDDVLNVRSGPGVENDIVATLAPTATGVALTGRETLVGSSVWVEIVTDKSTGWVNEYFLAEPDSSTNPFSDMLAMDLVDELAAAFAGRGDLTELASRRGIFVAHHDRARPFKSLDTLLTDPSLYGWAGTGCKPEDCPNETPKLTFAEAVADSFLSAWNDEDRQVTVDEVIPGGNGMLPEFIVPTEFANLHFVAVQDPGDNPDFDGLDWFTWYVYFAYENDAPVVLGMSIDAWAP